MSEEEDEDRAYYRDKYLGLFAYHLHLSPRQVDELSMQDFNRLTYFIQDLEKVHRL